MNAQARQALMSTLQQRFESNMQRHRTLHWQAVHERIARNNTALASLQAMEASGGEPDVIGQDESGAPMFCDCSAESPSGRRSLCFDQQGRISRKDAAPESSAQERAAQMGVRLLTEQDYRLLQTLGEFDRKTSSWIETPAEIRALGGALFCDRRYGQVFTYHNGAQSYYAARGFRVLLRV
jgi:hypothetical protein